MTEQTFVLFGGGDCNVGITSTEMEVKFNGNFTWDKNSINQMKIILKEWDDNGATVMTEEEYDDMIQAELEQMREFEIDRQILERGTKNG